MKKLFSVLLFVVLSLFVGVKGAHAIETPYLNGSSVGGGSVKLWWSAVSDATYQVFYGPKENPYAHGVTLGTGTSYTVGSLFANTTYVFVVKAIKGNEVSGHSNHVHVWVSDGRAAEVAQAAPAAAVPLATTYNQASDTMRTDAVTNSPKISTGKPGVGTLNLRTTQGLASGTIILHWNEPAEFGSYNIVYTDDPMVEKWGVLNVSRDQRVYTVGGLVPGRRYWFWMSTAQGGRTPWVSDVAR